MISPALTVLIPVIIGFLAGVAVPTHYGLERLAGLGRWIAAKLPYRPPPGQTQTEALREASKKDGYPPEDE
jgi:hypothetical protein